MHYKNVNCYSQEVWQGLTLKYRISLKYLLLYPRVLAADGCQVLQDQLRALRLTSPTLSTKSRFPKVNNYKTEKYFAVGLTA